MPEGNEELYRKTLTAEPDHTPNLIYSIKLSERDVECFQNIKNRNGGGITAGSVTENIAIWKVIEQVCEANNTNEVLDNYD